MAKSNGRVSKISELRKERGEMTQLQLAKEIGTSQTSVSLWEKDISKISGIYLVKLCRFFDVTANEILGIQCGERESV